MNQTVSHCTHNIAPSQVRSHDLSVWVGHPEDPAIDTYSSFDSPSSFSSFSSDPTAAKVFWLNWLRGSPKIPTLKSKQMLHSLSIRWSISISFHRREMVTNKGRKLEALHFNSIWSYLVEHQYNWGNFFNKYFVL